MKLYKQNGTIQTKNLPPPISLIARSTNGNKGLLSASSFTLIEGPNDMLIQYFQGYVEIKRYL